MSPSALPLIGNVGLPILLGGAVYALWRSPSLLMFEWFDALGTGDLLMLLRRNVAGLTAYMPEAIRYSFPDAAWVYAATYFQGFVWRTGSRACYWGWLSIPPLLGVGGEIGQASGLVPGTFSYSDLCVCVMAACLATVMTLKRRRNEV